MGTQAITSIIGVDGATRVKIIVGANGQSTHEFVRELREQKPQTLEDIYDLALSVYGGVESSLVVMDAEEIIYRGGERSDLSEFYVNTFSDPAFNPRWSQGTADYIATLRESEVFYDSLVLPANCPAENRGRGIEVDIFDIFDLMLGTGVFGGTLDHLFELAGRGKTEGDPPFTDREINEYVDTYRIKPGYGDDDLQSIRKKLRGYRTDYRQSVA